MKITRSIIFCMILITMNMITSTQTDDSLQNLDNSASTKHGSTSTKNTKSINLLSSLRQQIQEKETELENAEKINRNFERMIQLVNIMGQVDTFLTDRTKVLLKKLALLAEDMDGGEGLRRSGGGSYDIRF